jgi:effector-binding domain-containing protein
MPGYDVVIKKIKPMKVASVRGVIPQPSDQSSLWRQLAMYLMQQHVRPSGTCFALYHDREYKERDWDIEVCEPINENLPPTKYVNVHDLPAVETMACVVHAGPLTTIGEAYDGVRTWLGENKYQIVGPCREVSLREPSPAGNPNDPATVTEIQYPVEKTG